MTAKDFLDEFYTFGRKIIPEERRVYNPETIENALRQFAERKIKSLKVDDYIKINADLRAKVDELRAEVERLRSVLAQIGDLHDDVTLSGAEVVGKATRYAHDAIEAPAASKPEGGKEEG